QEFLYVGELEPSNMAVAPGSENHGMACFALRPALPSTLWVRFGGAPLGNLDFTPIDGALDSLRSPTTVEARLGVLRQLVEFWHGPIKPENGMSDAELALLWQILTQAAACCISIFGSVDIAVEVVEPRAREWRDVRRAELVGAVDR